MTQHKDSTMDAVDRREVLSAIDALSKQKMLTPGQAGLLTATVRRLPTLSPKEEETEG